MKANSIKWILGAFALTACSSGGGILNGNSKNSLDSYFATSVGKVSGHAKALGEACPSLSFKQSELDLHRVAICRGGGLADDCTVPNLDKAMQQEYTDTLATLGGKAPAQVCTEARAEMATDSVLAEYLK